LLSITIMKNHAGRWSGHVKITENESHVEHILRPADSRREAWSQVSAIVTRFVGRDQ
jgi:hypothetical protein